jgi:hypothetical protein
LFGQFIEERAHRRTGVRHEEFDMAKYLMVAAFAVMALMANAPVASAASTASTTASSQICILGFICIPLPTPTPGHGHGGSPAPAPLLAAGIPAFALLGGGALVSRLRRQRKASSEPTSDPA